MDDFLDLWRTLPAWIRIPVATLTMAAAWAILSEFHAPKLAALVLVLGMVMLFFGPSDAQRRGYHD